MQNLQNLISQLESKISQFETTNHAVSGGSVGWHIEHSLKTIDQIVTAYSWPSCCAYRSELSEV